MLYVGIDQHRKQLTVSVRDESGNVILRRQVSTEWKRVRAFFDELRELASAHGGYLAVVEVCGFNGRGLGATHYNASLESNPRR